jgi:hypothetical protein
VKFGVDGVGLSELIFKDDDAARRIEGGTLAWPGRRAGDDPHIAASTFASARTRGMGGHHRSWWKAALIAGKAP